MYRIIWDESINGLLGTFQAHDLVVQEASTMDGKWRFRLLAADREMFASFTASCREKEIPITVRRLSGSNAQDTILYGLTEKQRDIQVEMAVERFSDDLDLYKSRALSTLTGGREYYQ